MSSVIEKQDILVSGSHDRAAIDNLFAFTQVNTSDSSGNTISIWEIPAREMEGLKTVVLADYSFTKSPPGDPNGNFLGQLFQWFMWAIGIGFLIALIFYVFQVRINLGTP